MTLRKHLIDSFSHIEEPEEPLMLRDCQLVAFAPRSSLGLMHLKGLITSGAQFVLAVDDYYSEHGVVEGIETISSSSFLERKSEFENLVAIDFSQSPYTQGFYAQLAIRVGCQSHDLLQLLACFNAPSVYQSVREYRKETILRADDWLTLSDRLADDQSRETLYAVLLQRLKYDRCWIQKQRLGGRDEYFGVSSETTTFSLGEREDFVDCGAHRGTIIQKLLQTTNWKYSSIHAFEPDTLSYQALKSMVPWELKNFFPHNLALSNTRELLKFNDTGTMGSCVSDSGSSTIQCVKLDDMVDTASFIKLDVEGYEAKALLGAKRLISSHRPRLAVASYHYANDLLEIAKTIDDLAHGYRFYLRHHFGYFYDTILYATPRDDWQPLESAM